MVVAGRTSFQKGYNSSQMGQLLGMVALREKRMLATSTSSYSRASNQLSTLGKLKRETNAVHSEVPEAFEGIVPASHPFTCCTIMESLLKKEFAPLYGMDGVCKRAVPDPEGDQGGWSPNSQMRGPVGWAPDTAPSEAPADSDALECVERE